jgi:tubulin polyglutamylase TTLL6/13
VNYWVCDSEKLWRDICDIVVKTVIAAQVNLAAGMKSARPDPDIRSPFGCFEVRCRSCQEWICFIGVVCCIQLLGFDIILQENTFKPSLLEVNHTPSFKTDSALDKSIKLRLIMVRTWRSL